MPVDSTTPPKFKGRINKQIKHPSKDNANILNLGAMGNEYEDDDDTTGKQRGNNTGNNSYRNGRLRLPPIGTGGNVSNIDSQLNIEFG